MAESLANSTFTVVLIALFGGILPALFWLWFWLREDSQKPEPKRLLLFVFLAGMLSTIPVFFLQKAVHEVLAFGIILIFAWAGIEEAIKYVVAAVIGFHNKAFDEPIDPMMYLITAALGFAALENSLFLYSSMTSEALHISIISASLRFIGATLLHVLSSAIFGGIIALAYCKSRWARLVYTLIGGAVATLLHTLFNYFIMKHEGGILLVFSALWIGILVLLLFFERVKFIVCNIKFYKNV